MVTADLGMHFKNFTRSLPSHPRRFRRASAVADHESDQVRPGYPNTLLLIFGNIPLPLISGGKHPIVSPQPLATNHQLITLANNRIT